MYAGLSVYPDLIKSFTFLIISCVFPASSPCRIAPSVHSHSSLNFRCHWKTRDPQHFKLSRSFNLIICSCWWFTLGFTKLYRDTQFNGHRSTSFFHVSFHDNTCAKLLLHSKNKSECYMLFTERWHGICWKADVSLHANMLIFAVLLGV